MVKINKRQVVSVYDGDTFKIRIRMDPPLAKTISIRVLRMDTPELNSSVKWEKKLAVEARDYLKKRLKKARSIKLKQVKWDKYGGRMLAVVIINGRCIAEQMINEGLARPYDGGARGPWRRPKKKVQRMNWRRFVMLAVVAIGIVGANYG